MATHRPEGFLKNLVEPLKPSGRFPSFLRRYQIITKPVQLGANKSMVAATAEVLATKSRRIYAHLY
jgi:hypothetical protein